MAVFSSDMHARRERALKEDTSLNSMIVLQYIENTYFQAYIFPRELFLLIIFICLQFLLSH